MTKYRVGIMGCGRISNQYLQNFRDWFPATVELAACADINADAARAIAKEYGIARVESPEELIADSGVDVVLNLTNPWAHTEINRAALDAGKHVYAEKPLALTREDARTVIELADEKGLRVGCAPDTFLGAGLQTCIKLVDEGWIGEPSAATAQIVMGHAATSARYQSAGIGGVLLDMGPYFVTALIAMFGPVRRVAGFTRVSAESRTITDMRHAEFGTSFPVEAPTTVAGTLEMDAGVLAHLTTTVDGHTYGPSLSVVGSEGMLVCNDPNMFGGEVWIERRGGERLRMPLTHQYNDRNRGLGLVEMMVAADAGRPHRASGRLAYHCLDTLLALTESAADGRYREPERMCERPERFAPGHVASPLL